MRFLRQNTAVIITCGPFYDKTDGVTIETGLTITNERITLTADTDAGSAPTNILDNVTGATSGTANDLNYITGNDAGIMQLELAAADTNRVGRMFLSITDAANHVPVFHEFFVLPQAIYDWLTGVIVPLPANVTQISGDSTAADNAELMFDGTGYAGGTTKLDVNTASITNNAITAAAIANGAIDNATFAADVGSTAYATNIIALAADKAIANYDAPTKTEMDTAFTEIKGATFASTDTLESIRNKLPTNLEDMSITDTTGLVDITQAAADKVWGTAARVLTANTNLNDPSAATIADAVWDEASTGHIDAGKAGQQLWTDVDAIAVDVAGLDGAAMRGTDSAALASVCTEARLSELDAATGGKMANQVDIIQTDTTTDIPGVLGSPAGASISADIAAIEAQTDDIGIAGAGLTAVPWNATWDAEVQSEVFDALDAAFTDATGLTANGLLDRIRTLGWIQRNKITVTDANGNTVIYKDDSVTAGFTVNAALTDDSTTTTRLRMA